VMHYGVVRREERYLVTTNLFPHKGIVLWIGSSYAEALFLPLL
jgi:hypothetical protein